MTSFKDRLKILRERKGLTQPQLAEEVGLSKSTIGMYEQGRRTPELETLEMLADYFNVDLDYLAGRTNKITVLPQRLAFEGRQGFLFDRIANASEEDLVKLNKLLDIIENEKNHS